MPRSRTFLGFALSSEQIDRATELQESLARHGAGVNWVSADNLHVTLLFLGDVDDRELYTVCRVTENVCKSTPSFPLSLRGLGAFPNLRRPKVVWVGIDEPEPLYTLHEHLTVELQTAIDYRQEERGYTPHLTLGRVTDDITADTLAKELGKWALWGGGQHTATELLVFQSDMTRHGPVYTVAARCQLRG
jgi:2'-5' RNA ligase